MVLQTAFPLKKSDKRPTFLCKWRGSGGSEMTAVALKITWLITAILKVESARDGNSGASLFYRISYPLAPMKFYLAGIGEGGIQPPLRISVPGRQHRTM